MQISSSLDDIIAEHVEPGMTIFLDSTAMAAVRALVRVFHGTSPNFTVVVPRGGMVAPELIEAGLLRKLIAGGLLNGHLGRIPLPVIQDAHHNGTVEIELLSLQATALRLMAGAMKWPFVPSRSIVDSDLERTHPTAVARVEDPFEKTSTLVLRPLVTDVAIGHAVVADGDGRAVFPDSSDHGGWGLRACHRGVIVAAEAIMDTVPSETAGQRWVAPGRVLAVCETPQAAHPYGFTSPVPELVPSYEDDRAALAVYVDRGAGETATEGQGTPASHLDHVRGRRAGPGEGDVRRRDITFAESVYLAGSELARLVQARGLRSVLEGSGKAKLISNYAVAVTEESGGRLERVGGVGGLNGEHVGANPIEAYGYLLGGLEARSAGVLSALQIDRVGNINNTELADGPTMLVGSGGANDAGAHCDEILVVTSGHPSSLVRQAEFITVPGNRVRLIVAGRCVFERAQDGCFQLARILGAKTAATEALIASAGDNGWHVDCEPDVVPLPDVATREFLERVLKS